MSLDKKDWLKLQIVFEFVFIYVISYFSFSFILTSFKIECCDILSVCFFSLGIFLFLLDVLIFDDMLDKVEELTILKIKESEKK
jgi:hypothetical protein